MENIQKMFFMKLIYLISRVFFAVDFLKFSGPLNAGSIHDDLGTLLNNVTKVSQEESINVKNFKEINTTKTSETSEKCRKITNNMKAVVEQLLKQHRKVPTVLEK